MKLLTKVVVLAGKVTKLVDVDVLGARVWVVVETYGAVMYSAYVWTLADGLFINFKLQRGLTSLLTWLNLCFNHCASWQSRG